MKKLLLTMMALALCSCSGGGSAKFNLKGFQKNENKYLISVNNDQTSFDFKHYVETSFEWNVSSDSFGKETFLTKTVPLEVGNNEYYVITSDENFTTYDCVIRRLDMFTITFNSNGGSYVQPLEVQEGTIVTDVPVPVREGYTFDGWNFDFSKPIESNLNLTARWTASGFYTVNYDVNGGIGSEESMSVELGSSNARYSIGMNISKNGYYLDSWNTKQDGTGNSYAPGSLVRSPKAETVTLYAIWHTNELWDGTTKNTPISDGTYYYVRRASELSFYGKTILLNDIDLNNKEWKPVPNFTGEFDGNNHKILNMKITSKPSSGNIGLVGTNKGLIKNVILDNYTISLNSLSADSERYVGGLVGENRGIPSGGDGKVVNCKANGTITINGSTCSLCVGGLIGRTQSYYNTPKTYIENCSSSGTITINSSASVSCGGIVGNDTWNPIKSSYSKTSLNVITTGRAYVGGLIGNYIGGDLYTIEISNCVAMGNIAVSSGTGAVSAFLSNYDYLPSDQLRNNYSLNTQTITFNGDNLTSSGGSCRVETRTSLETIKANIPYNID